MNIEIDAKSGIIKFSNELAEKIKLKPNQQIFLFRLKDTKTFGFMQASNEQSKAMICAPIKRSVSGFIYIHPHDPSVSYIASVMRLKGRKKMNIKEQPLKNTKMYIFDYGTSSSK